MDIATYRTLFTVFLILTIIFAVLTAVLFFLFDIKKIISVKTGYAVRKSVKQVNALNQKENEEQKIKKKAALNQRKTVSSEATAVLENERERDGKRVVEERHLPISDEPNTEEGFEIIETKQIRTSEVIIDGHGKIKRIV
ncbi:MAG: hypothetical protein NC300_08920 [Bacteroidales bacterium]|nr:hypothetical protein [Clostridium sp.]MCM1204251.1 hypothetical protein [Bacteroidales bacterium]